MALGLVSCIPSTESIGGIVASQGHVSIHGFRSVLTEPMDKTFTVILQPQEGQNCQVYQDPLYGKKEWIEKAVLKAEEQLQYQDTIAIGIEYIPYESAPNSGLGQCDQIQGSTTRISIYTGSESFAYYRRLF